MNMALYQGAPSKKGMSTLVRLNLSLLHTSSTLLHGWRFALPSFLLSQAMAASANPLLAERETRDPTLFCTAYKKQRFYLFSRLEPEDTKGGDRDVFNEKPTREEASVALAQPAKVSSTLGNSAVIHTTKGDIVRLPPIPLLSPPSRSSDRSWLTLIFLLRFDQFV
jgi:peptidylprolyl isomerase domain and WD repeat-containing protein 1